MLKKLGQLFFQRGIIAQFYLRMNNLAGECVMRNYTKRELAGFVVPSVVGIFLFMIPIRFHGEWTIIVKIIADYIGAWLGGFLPLLCVIIVTVSAVLGLLSLKKPSFISSYPIIDNTFSTTPIWAIIRCVGAVFIWLTYLGVSAGEDSIGIIHMITESGAGGFVLSELLTVLVITVDCITSWIGDGTLGVMLTCNQYEGGFYSEREASVIATTFSAVSITFSIVVLAQVDLMEYFGLYYLVICLIGIVCAMILPRIPPLSRHKDVYLVEGRAMAETLPEGYTSSAQYGLDLAVERVREYRGIGQFLESGLKNSAGMWFGVMPVVMCIGTLALLLANNTQIFEILGTPFLPLLKLLHVPEAAEASKTMIVGFTDMFTPSILAAGSISSPMTKFIVAVSSVTQLIYLSEVGGLILGSKIPVNIGELFLLFLERTIIGLLIVCPIAHLIF